MFEIGDTVWVKYPYMRNTQTPVLIRRIDGNSVLVYSVRHAKLWTTTMDEIISKNT